MTRFPFPSFPVGWFAIGFSDDFPADAVKTVHYFGRDIVVFRTASGVLTALDKTCPHLGAHLGGGRVDGERLRCPFHDWAFAPDGRCVEVPYAPKIPPRARATTWPLCEQNGVVLVYHHPAGELPAWKPPVLEERGWTRNRTIRWELRSHPQEVGENTVDCAHLAPVHHVSKTEVLEVEQRDHYMRVLLHLVASGYVIGMPDEINDVHLDVALHGLGHIVSSTHVVTAGLRTRQRIHPTPIDGESIAIFAAANTLEMPDPDYTREIDEIFWQAFTADFVRDFPIWDKKAYLDRPLLASGDGPIGAYRKWCRQFYVRAAKVEAPVAPRDEPQSNARTLGDDAAPKLRSALGAAVERARALIERVRRLEMPFATRATETDTAVRAPAARVAAVAGKPRFPSVDAYFQSLARRFDPAAAGELEAVFQWTLTGAERREHFATVRAGTIEIGAGVHASPTVTIEMSTDDYLRMINGELNGALAFSTGRGKLRGPVRLAMRMQQLFPLDRNL